jgi:CubicO group peptidase (beta-lactamase class C family)
MSQDADFQKFDDFVFSKMSESKLPSATVSIVRDGEIVHKRAFGFKNVETATPASINTTYGIGSVTKSFTALAICRLAEEGKLNLHDPISKFFPSIASRQKTFDEIELHHLLTHSSGLPGLGWAEVSIFSALGKTKNWLPVASADDMASFLDEAQDWKEASPGSKFFYLNEGYFLLGEVISKVSGKSYYDFVKEKILEPLKMNRTFLTKQQLDIDGDWSVPYLIEKDKVSPSVIPWGSGAAGGLLTNVLDLSNYVMMYINRGELSGKRIIGRDMIERMETPVSKPSMSIFPDTGYGYGLSITKQFFGQKLVRHDGSVAVYSAGMAYLPEKKIGISLLINADNYSPSLITMYALGLMLGKDPEKDFPPLRREKLLKRLEGTYKAYKETITAQVKRSGDFLLLSGEDIGSAILVPDESDKALEEGVATFFTLEATARMQVEFRFNDRRTEMIFERYKYRKLSDSLS